MQQTMQELLAPLEPHVQAYVLADQDLQDHILQHHLDSEEIDSLVYGEMYEQKHDIVYDTVPVFLSPSLTQKIDTKMRTNGLTYQMLMPKLLAQYAER